MAGEGGGFGVESLRAADGRGARLGALAEHVVVDAHVAEGGGVIAPCGRDRGGAGVTGGEDLVEEEVEVGGGG